MIYEYTGGSPSGRDTFQSDPMNSINIISPYKLYGSWVFDDERVGLVQEPFVAGADIMMERLVADIPDAAKGFVLIF